MKRHQEESPGTLLGISATAARSSRERILVPLRTARPRALWSQRLKSHVAPTAGARSPRVLLAQGPAPHALPASTLCWYRSRHRSPPSRHNSEHSSGDRSQSLLQSLLLSHTSPWPLRQHSGVNCITNRQPARLPQPARAKVGLEGESSAACGSPACLPCPVASTAGGEGGAPGAKLSCFSSCESRLLRMPS